jgi:glucose/arabinose dehydrogenase
MSSRAGRVAVVAGLVALGMTEGVDARADEANAPADSSTAVSPPAARSAKRTSAKKTASKAVAGLVATLPGFEMLPDGGSRFFVELTHTTNVTEKREARALTYVIQGAHVVYRNNENALVTVHFNTPVTRARLLPVRNDLVFSVELRADAVPVWRMVDQADGTSMLQIDFPKGSFLPVGEDAVDVASEALPRPPGASDPPPTAPIREHRARGRRGSAPPPAPPVVGPPADGAPAAPPTPSGN